MRQPWSHLFTFHPSTYLETSLCSALHSNPLSLLIYGTVIYLGGLLLESVNQPT